MLLGRLVSFASSAVRCRRGPAGWSGRAEWIGGTVLLLLLTVQAASAQTLAPVPVISTVAGNGKAGYSGDNGPALAAETNQPYSVAIDRAGNMYFVEWSNYIVRRVDGKTGILTTFAGQAGKQGYQGDNQQATGALFQTPYSIAFDNNGNLLVVDPGNSTVRSITPGGIITTIAGTGTAGYNGDGIAATSAELKTPHGVWVDPAGDIYIADTGNYRVRRIDHTTLQISTIAGDGKAGSTNGADATSAEFQSPYFVTGDLAGNLYVSDSYHNTVIRKISGGVVTPFAGNGTAGHTGDGGPAASAEIDWPLGMHLDAFGNLYFAEHEGPTYRKVDPNGIITTVTGLTKDAYSGDGGPATAASVDYPIDVFVDQNNDIYIGDTTSDRVREISLNTRFPATPVGSPSAVQNVMLEASTAVTPGTAVLSAAGAGQFTLGTLSGCALGASLAAGTPCETPITFTPAAPGVQTGQLVITDASGNLSTIGLSGTGTAPAVSFTPAAIATIAGDGAAGSSATEVSAPRGGVIDSAGNVYFADSGNNAIRRIDGASGVLTTVAGTGMAGYTGDGGAATSAQLNAPAKVVLDAAGDLYIADTGNNAIRYVDAGTGLISTMAGTGAAGYTGDGGPATAATLNQPQGLAIDQGGHLYVADTGNNVIRSLVRGGVIVTLSGTGTAGYTGDGGNMYGAEYQAPEAIALDQSGDIYVADAGNDVIRMISNANQISTVAGQQGDALNSGDGGAAAAAALDQPSDIALDAAGDLYIAAGGQIRMVNTSGAISTLAGTGAQGGYTGDGGPATEAALPSPVSNLMVDGSGNVVIADTGANLVLKVSPATPAAVNLGGENPGSTGAPQIITLLNTGDSALNMSAISVSAGFTQVTGGASDCTATTSLAPGQSCSIGVAFSPDASASGDLTGAVTLTDNALNNAAATQVIPLAGTAKMVATTTTTVTVTPGSIVYGATATASAVVSGGGSPTGSVTFSVGGTTIGTAQLSSSQASITLPALAAGTESVSAIYSGDANNTSSSGSASITIQPAPLTITADDATISQGGAVPALTYTATGFVNGDTVRVLTGAPTETTTATPLSSPGAYPITITQGDLAAANYSLTFVNGTLTVQPPPPADFNLTATPTSLTMNAGQTEVVLLTVTPTNSTPGTIQFSCGTMPTNVGCSFVPASVTADGSGAAMTTYLYVATVNLAASAGEKGRRTGPERLLALAGLPLFCCLLSGRRRRTAVSGILLILALLAVVLAGVSSCGAPGRQVANPGTSTIPVTAANAAGNISHQVTISLTVR